MGTVHIDVRDEDIQRIHFLAGFYRSSMSAAIRRALEIAEGEVTAVRKSNVTDVLTEQRAVERHTR